MINRIRQQMLDRLQTPDLSALEVESALNVLLILQNHPTLLNDNHSEVPFASILEHVEPPKELDPPMKAIQAGKKITMDKLREKIVEKRDSKGLNVKQFLNGHGYQKLSDVSESAYADLYKEVCDA